MSDWYEELEQAEQEYEAKLEEEAWAYKDGYNDGYEQGKADERARILGMADYKVSDDPVRRLRNIEISFDALLSAEQVVSIILEQLKEQK